VVIIAVLFLVLANMKGGSSRHLIIPFVFAVIIKVVVEVCRFGKAFRTKPRRTWRRFGRRAAAKKATSSSSIGRRVEAARAGNVVVLGGGGRTRVETREVTKEVVKEVPKEPMPITCPFCSRSYVPVDKYICPSCGAATPKNLIEESQMPKE
jgi:hypothetical protein